MFSKKLNLFLLVTLFLTSINSIAADDFLSSPLPNTIALCQIYEQIADDLGCGDENYLISFGFNYCKKYQAIEQNFSIRTQKILSRIRVCLIQSLLDENNLTCENVQKKAAGHHIKCYIESGFCQTSMWERIRLAKVALPALFSKSLRKSLFEINNTCQAQN